jgi:hypothetical protein
MIYHLPFVLPVWTRYGMLLTLSVFKVCVHIAGKKDEKAAAFLV